LKGLTMTTAVERKMTKVWVERRSNWTLLIMAEIASGGTMGNELRRVVARNDLTPEQHVRLANNLAEEIAKSNNASPAISYEPGMELLTA